MTILCIEVAVTATDNRDEIFSEMGSFKRPNSIEFSPGGLIVKKIANSKGYFSKPC